MHPILFTSVWSFYLLHNIPHSLVLFRMDNWLLALLCLLCRSHHHILHLPSNYLPNHNECIVSREFMSGILVANCVSLKTVGLKPINDPKLLFLTSSANGSLIETRHLKLVRVNAIWLLEKFHLGKYHHWQLTLTINVSFVQSEISE